LWIEVAARLGAPLVRVFVGAQTKTPKDWQSAANGVRRLHLMLPAGRTLRARRFAPDYLPQSDRSSCSAISTSFRFAQLGSIFGSPSKALVAFTDVVKDAKDGQEYTEAKMTGFPEAATGDRFEGDEYRFLIVASKFQTGTEEKDE